MARPQKPTHTPEQALPLLEQALAAGKVLTKARSIRQADAEQWIEQVSTLFVATYGRPSPELRKLNEVSSTTEFYQSYTRDRGSKIEERCDEAVRATVSDLATYIQLIKAKLQPTPAPASSTPNNGRLASQNKVFIGHGRAAAWLELQRFFEARLHLEVVEFNSVPTAGTTIIDRLKAMMDAVGFAFLVMTAEDDVGDGSTRARQNVIHEIGLFQGRLGFDRAIILLEQGCAEFSNVSGLVYIPFPKGNIRAAFEEIRATLEAAGLVKPAAP